MSEKRDVREVVREGYARIADADPSKSGCCGSSPCCPDRDVDSLAEHFGIEIDIKKKKRADTSQLKKQAKALREERDKKRSSASRKELDIMRKKIKRTKRSTRKAVI